MRVEGSKKRLMTVPRAASALSDLAPRDVAERFRRASTCVISEAVNSRMPSKSLRLKIICSFVSCPCQLFRGPYLIL